MKNRELVLQQLNLEMALLRKQHEILTSTLEKRINSILSLRSICSHPETMSVSNKDFMAFDCIEEVSLMPQDLPMPNTIVTFCTKCGQVLNEGHKNQDINFLMLTLGLPKN